MGSLLILIDTVISLYTWMIIVSIILSWLIVFNVINTYNQFVAMVRDFLYRITEPALAPIRRFMPDLGGIDLAPLVLILLLFFLRNLLHEGYSKLIL
jgi:YggT family protein